MIHKNNMLKLQTANNLTPHDCEDNPLGESLKFDAFLDSQILLPGQFIYLHDLKNGLFYQKGFKSALGHDLEELLPDFFVKSIHPTDLPLYFKISKAYKAFLADEAIQPKPFQSSFKMNYRIRKLDGTYTPILRRLTPFCVNENHEVTVFLSLCSDISFLSQTNQMKWSVNGHGANDALFDQYAETDNSSTKNLFSGREVDVLKLLVRGYSSSRIANSLFISVNTVNTHRKNLMKKANLNKTVDLVTLAIKLGYKED